MAISEKASIQTIALVAAPYALLFEIGELRLSAHLRRHFAKRRGFLINGFCEFALGVAAAYYVLSQRAAMLLAYVAILSILQLVPFLFYKREGSSL